MRSFLVIIATAVALVASSARADEAAVRSTLQNAFPQASIRSISKTPVAGVVEAVIDDRIFYLSEDGRYVIGGPLLDSKTSENLTEIHLKQIDAIPFDSLPLDDAIKRVKGNGSRRLAIFEDPDCPFCKKLEGEMKGIDNLTVYVFLYPIEALHPGSSNKSKAIWCAADRGRAWDDAMGGGTGPSEAANCKNPVQKNLAYGRAHGITGTPTMILANGQRLIGAVPRDELEQQLAQAEKK